MNMVTEDHDPAHGPDDPGTTAADSVDENETEIPEHDPDAAVADADSAERADDGHGDPVDGASPADTAAEAADDPSADASTAAEGYATDSIKRICEAALLVAGRPLAITDFEKLFGGSTEAPPRNALRGALAELATDWSERSLALQEVASGWRAQVRTEFEPWIARLWDEKPPRYSRALLETLAIIAYRQPMTRSEIEDIRGVSVSSQIIRTLTEREWIRVVGHREAPGRPAMYGTTREFLDYFNLKTLDQLPPISDIKDLEGQYPELGFEAEPASGGDAPDDAVASPDPHAEDVAETTQATGDGDPASASAGGAETNGKTGGGRDPAEDVPSTEDLEDVDDAVTPEGDTLSATDDDADEDDAEESPCTPAS